MIATSANTTAIAANTAAIADLELNATDPATISAMQDALCVAFAGLGVLPPADLGCSASTDKVVFVTQGLFNGSELTGLLGADAICQEEAMAAGLSGAFRAWLSDEFNGVTSRLRFRSEYRYLLANGTFVGTAGQVLDILNADLSSPVNRDAHGNSISGETRVWTNTQPIGGTLTFNDCWGWTRGSGVLGVYGSTLTTTDSWTHVNAISYGVELRLYCFEQ